MTGPQPSLLLVGEIFVDVTITPPNEENKLRLGGIVHAARGLWALGIPFATAVVVPSYLEQTAKDYLVKFGCVEYSVLGQIVGAPNVILIFDPTEVDDQHYEDLLRDEKRVELSAAWDSATIVDYSDAIIFPGRYDLAEVCRRLPKSLRLHIDVAYDVDDIAKIAAVQQVIRSVFISTSSPLFMKTSSSGIDGLAHNFALLKPETLVLKENRGGSRVYTFASGHVENIPAQLGITVNSVGVGDVFDATYVAQLHKGSSEAAWRAALASSAYAQTTEPDTFETYIQRDLKLSATQIKDLGGTCLAWERRKDLNIYLAAPDFARSDRRAIERAISALKYHNFNVRRPVVENGELPSDSDALALSITYRKDVELLNDCHMVFAVPTGRDPGTLVEIGLAIERNLPVVVFDPDGECANTMVIAGSGCYSRDLDACLNATFDCLSRVE
jgi:nucleoside 2-deoxyribosyltransferase/sugar/nucleoside kinase (ribokinase family)